jgi:NADH-quinone oxidoreductase subunit C
MDASKIYEHIKKRFGDVIGEFDTGAVDPSVSVNPDSLLDVARVMAAEEELAFDSLMCLSAVDYPETVLLVYSLHSMKNFHKFTLKVEVPKESLAVPSVESVWRTADWHEREAYDLFGVEFQGHPDLRRILLPEDWEGYPLRKDYQAPEEYRDIEV